MNRNSLGYFRLSFFSLHRLLVLYWRCVVYILRTKEVCNLFFFFCFVSFSSRSSSLLFRKKSIDFMRIHGSQVRNQPLTSLRFQQQEYNNQHKTEGKKTSIILIGAKANLFFQKTNESSLISNTNKKSIAPRKVR